MNKLCENLKNQAQKKLKKYEKYGAIELFMCVTVGALSKIIKKNKLQNNQELALQLYDLN